MIAAPDNIRQPRKDREMKTSKLTGAALDWAVAKCADLPYPHVYDEQGEIVEVSPSTDWAQGGPIIEREGINLDNYAKNPQWSAWIPTPERELGEAQAFGPTPLIAAMRCYVASKLGDEVEIPEELNNLSRC
jgi:hypothetical protein